MNKLIRITTIPLSLDKLLGEQLRFMNQHFEVIAVSSNQIELKKVAEKYGVKYHSLEMSRKITPFLDLISLYKMYLFLKKEKPKIVHTHTPKAGIIGMIAAYYAGIPVRMHTVAGLPLLEASGSKRKILNFVEKLTYRYATHVYPNSYGLQEIILKESFCDLSKLKVIGNGSSNGINTDFFDVDQISEEQKSILRKRLNISANDFVFIFVGRLVKDKGIEELVSAFSELKQSNNHLVVPKLLLVGPFENDLDPLSSETLEKLSTNPNIVSVGFQEDVRVFFAISDALVFPSYREGFPNVVLQAGAMQLPSIVSDINGCNEIVEHEINGLIIPVKNKAAITEAMSRLYQDASFYQFLKTYSRQKITEKFNQNLIWNEILKEYQKT